MRSITLLVVLLSGCVAPSEILRNNDGHFVRCSASGWGFVGAPLAYRTVSNCVNDFEGIGYKKVK